MSIIRLTPVLLSLLLIACGGGGGGGSNEGATGNTDSNQVPCSGQCGDSAVRLTVADVKRVLAQGIAQAQTLGVDATIAVVDRVGNVLAVQRMAAQSQAVTIGSTFPVTVNTGLEGVILPAGTNGDALAAIAKAVTGAYLSSEGNAFSTRTASQIVQEHFNPGERNQAGGPLFGVQFSQLACSDFMLTGKIGGSTVGPQRTPLGLSADPGGFPLYKAGTVVGGVGVMTDGQYGLDKNVLDIDGNSDDESVAFAATYNFAANRDRRADSITLEGKTLRFSDVEFNQLAVSPEQAPPYDNLIAAGSLVAVQGYSDAAIKSGTAFGEAESGVRPIPSFGDLDAFGFVDSNNKARFSPRMGTDGANLQSGALTASEVSSLLQSALTVAAQSRAQIRRPLGSSARVTVSIVDSQGEILGILRSRDAPVFGADVSLQKARTATLFSSADAASFLRGITEPVTYLNPDLTPASQLSISQYVDAVQSFVGAAALTDGVAFSDRAGGNLSRPFYPDGIRGNPNGPFSKSFFDNQWSVFSTGLQLDLVLNNIIRHVLFAAGASSEDVVSNCAASVQPRLANGIQIFPGSVPIYRGSELVGGIGVSGDGIDQDDMIAFLGVHRAAEALGGSINNAPSAIRADRLQPMGVRLRYIQCPQSPFLNSDAQQVCSGK